VSRRYSVSHGIVIRRRPLPSGDVVVTILSESGKWAGVARKGKLPGGNLGRLSLFHDVTVQYYRRRDDDSLALLTQVRLNGALPRLSAPDVYPYANLLAELTDALTVDTDLGEPLYHYLASGLRGLAAHHDPELVSLLYAWRLLGQAGLAPQSASAAGDDGQPASGYTLDVSAGLLYPGPGAGLPLDRETGEELRELVHGSMHGALGLPLARRDQHWRALARYLSYHVGELRSLQALLQEEGDMNP